MPQRVTRYTEPTNKQRFYGAYETLAYIPLVGIMIGSGLKNASDARDREFGKQLLERSVKQGLGYLVALALIAALAAILALMPK